MKVGYNTPLDTVKRERDEARAELSVLRAILQPGDDELQVRASEVADRALEAERFEAEVERLRAALELIASLECIAGCSARADRKHPHFRQPCTICIAQQALAQPATEEKTNE